MIEKKCSLKGYYIGVASNKRLHEIKLSSDMYIIGGKYKGRRLVAAASKEVRPTTAQLRETLFNICQSQIVNARFLDLFAGSGAMGFEALSRGAEQVTFVEKNRSAQAAIRKNIENLAVKDQTILYPYDVFKALQQFEKESFDLIYIDPPYGQNLGASALQTIDQLAILKPSGSLFIEEVDFDAPPDLSHLQYIHSRKAGRAQLLEYRTK